MNLRSAVITAVYAKSLVISAGALSRKSTGEVTNLMSVDATRLQVRVYHSNDCNDFNVLTALRKLKTS